MSEPKIGTMSVPNIGGLASESEGQDAIHMAVAPVVAGMLLLPGQRVGLLPDGRAAAIDPFVGVVDPFLRQPVVDGQRFWLLIQPNTITTLRHQWTHPAFGDDGTGRVIGSSEKWLRDFADDIGIDYERLMEGAAEKLLDKSEYGTAWITLNYDTPGRAYTDIEEFWEHYKNVVPSATVPDGYAARFITCSC